MPGILFVVTPNKGGKSANIRAFGFDTLASVLKVVEQHEAEHAKKAKKKPAKKPAKKKKARG